MKLDVICLGGSLRACLALCSARSRSASIKLLQTAKDRGSAICTPTIVQVVAVDRGGVVALGMEVTHMICGFWCLDRCVL
jgi:hypothetical protein